MRNKRLHTAQVCHKIATKLMQIFEIQHFLKYFIIKANYKATFTDINITFIRF